MISGVAYNVFNGEEHLLASIRSVRAHIDFVCLVVQRVSNVGRPAGAGLEETVERARSLGLADQVIWYQPDLAQAPGMNELHKRNLGLAAARRVGVTHFMTMDCDEYFVGEELERGKELIEEQAIQASAVPTYMHVRRPIWRTSEPDTTYCSFLSDIRSFEALEYGAPYPAPVDPTRRVNAGAARFHLFAPDELAMRHMNLVRLDLESKLSNSSNASATEFMQQVRSAYSDWRFGDVFRFPNKPPFQIIEVEDLFGIDHLFA